MTLEIVEDKFLDGRLLLKQPVTGYRSAIDPVLLAAAVPEVRPGGKVLDLGCGVGTALFCYGWRVPKAMLFGVELDAKAAELARTNADINMMQGRSLISTTDILSLPESDVPGQFYQVFANPPYMDTTEGNPSPDADRARSNMEGKARLKDWISVMLKLLRPKGGFTMIHRADRTDEIICHLHRRAGDITIIPLWPRDGEAARRVLIRARKGVKGGVILHPGIVLHGPGDARYTRAASKILREGAAIA
jgi:tRNA1(Val) A37 N6-methylase TrmN6